MFMFGMRFGLRFHGRNLQRSSQCGQLLFCGFLVLSESEIQGIWWRIWYLMVFFLSCLGFFQNIAWFVEGINQIVCDAICVYNYIKLLFGGIPHPLTSEIIICSVLWRAPYKPLLSTVSGPGISPNYSTFWYPQSRQLRELRKGM